jgi:hypothetical protein
LVAAVRWALVPALLLPATLAALGASVTADGVSLALAAPATALALVANLAGWRKVLERWRALPRPRGDDSGWPWRSDGDGPRDPSDGPGGAEFDWPAFERHFWAHVEAMARERELIAA